MVHAHGEGFKAAAGDPLTQRTYPLFFEVVRLLLVEGVTVVAEAAFQDRLWRQGLGLLEELADLRLVQCTVAASGNRAVHQPKVGLRRFAEGGQARTTVIYPWAGG